MIQAIALPHHEVHGKWFTLVLFLLFFHHVLVTSFIVRISV
jgi:hypothetical protein